MELLCEKYRANQLFAPAITEEKKSIEGREIKRRKPRHGGRVFCQADFMFRKYRKELYFLNKARDLKTIAVDCSRLIIDELIYKGKRLLLPFRLGNISIVKWKTRMRVNEGGGNNLKLDYKYYLDTGKKRYHFNKHTNGYYAICVWKRKSGVYMINDAIYWKKEIHRTFSRLLSKEFGSGNVDFVEAKKSIIKK